MLERAISIDDVEKTIENPEEFVKRDHTPRTVPIKIEIPYCEHSPMDPGTPSETGSKLKPSTRMCLLSLQGMEEMLKKQ